MTEMFCRQCGKEITEPYETYYCNLRCYRKFSDLKTRSGHCIQCGKKLPRETGRNHKRKYCSEKCGREREKERSKERRANKRAKINKPPVTPLAEMNARARAAGMTYGKYTAMMQKLKECESDNAVKGF